MDGATSGLAHDVNVHFGQGVPEAGPHPWHVPVQEMPTCQVRGASKFLMGLCLDGFRGGWVEGFYCIQVYMSTR